MVRNTAEPVIMQPENELARLVADGKRSDDYGALGRELLGGGSVLAGSRRRAAFRLVSPS